MHSEVKETAMLRKQNGTPHFKTAFSPTQATTLKQEHSCQGEKNQEWRDSQCFRPVN